jgi:chromosome segregation protein
LYLKRLEIHGFKSFADRTALDLQEGLNAVVGPNGSGKSNISDAILWVLGEQSARTLRGSRMEDVIFSGSSTRRPLGLAEVNLILDNTDGTLPLDYREVSIKRRLYRSGDSEYFINNASCRLKDIHELLVDTGLGKEAYSLIGQGRIDEVLSVRSEDRRSVVDDAAGIVKYKNRKKEAMRKLDDTRQNIVRVQDILLELESQLEPLAMEAEKANQYMVLKTEADELEIALALWSVQKLQDALSQQKIRRQRYQDDHMAMQTQISTAETRVEELQVDAAGLEEKLSQKQQELYQFQSQLERTENDLAHNNEQQADIARQQERLNKDLADLEREGEEAEEALTGEQESLQRIRTSLQELEDVLSLENRSHEEILREISRREEELESKKDHLLEQMNKAAETRHTIRMLTNDLDRFQAERNRKEREMARITEESAEKLAEIGAVQDLIRKGTSEKDQKTAQLKSLADEEQSLVRELDANAKERGTLDGQLRQIQSRLRVLEEMSRDYEGYHKGVRSVLVAAREKKLGAGICGVVSELFIADAAYEQAVATALGATLQNIIAERSKDAEAAIAFLKNNQGGRCTFLPLDVIQAGKRSDLLNMLSKESGMIGIAADLVQTDERFSGIKEYLLGQILVAQDMEHALAVARKSQFRIRLVTLDGDMISLGGAMSGGSRVGNQASLLGRPREIEDLKQAGADKEAEVRACSKRGSNLQQRIQKLKDEINQMQTLRGDLDRVLSEHARKLEQIQYQKDHLDKQMQAARLEAEDIAHLMQEADEKKTMLSQDSEADRETTAQMEAEISQLQAVLQTDVLAKEEIMAKVTDNKVTLAGIRQKETGLVEQVRMQERILKGCKERKKKVLEDLQALEQRCSTLAEKDAELKKMKDRVTRRKMELDEATAHIRHERQATLASIDQEERKLKRLRRRAADGQNEIYQLDMVMARQEMEIESHASRLQEKHRLTLETAARRVTVIADEQEVKDTISVLNDLMTALGDVHLGAVEEQRRVQERFSFLQSQFADLEEAQKGLQQVIQEIDKVMKKRFMETFALIRERFDEVVQRLFEGGKGDLWLTEPENPLESGLEITVQPPGKKLQNLSLMSGGEKALTAISLLFAVLMTRPASFCVLDEIDTSLDEANVDRFSRFLRDLVQDTQFIVVTHRKGTMETADVMYGVTMEESGVSKLISVRFSETSVS